MNVFDRILLTIQTLLFSIISILIVLFSTRFISYHNFSTSLQYLYGRWEVTVAGLVLLFISLKLLFSGLKVKRISETVIRNGDLGAVTISLGALENMVLSIIREVDNIKDVKVSIKAVDDGVSIRLKLVVNFDVVIPEITEELQNTIKSNVESTAGVIVKDVKICVENVSNQSKQKAVK